jgi:hypothetical protein
MCIDFSYLLLNSEVYPSTPSPLLIMGVGSKSTLYDTGSDVSLLCRCNKSNDDDKEDFLQELF